MARLTSINAILSACDDLNIRVAVYRSSANWDGKARWTAEFSKESEGEDVKLEAKSRGADADEAVRNAWVKFDSAAKHGLPALMAPVIQNDE